jgi:hypothetical protein
VSIIIYPIHFHSKFGRRWADRMVRPEPRRSPAEGTITCGCGEFIIAPESSTYLPTGVVNEWRCSKCGTRLQTVGNESAKRDSGQPD